MFYIKLDKINSNGIEYWNGIRFTNKLIMRKLFKTAELAEAEYQDKTNNGSMSHLARICEIR